MYIFLQTHVTGGRLKQSSEEEENLYGTLASKWWVCSPFGLIASQLKTSLAPISASLGQ